MTDLDTTIKALVNSAVDRELTGHRTAPPWDRSRLAERPETAHPVTLWSIPVLAASVAALLAVGTVVAIGHDRDQRSNPAGNSASPAPSLSISTSRSTSPDEEAAARAYLEAMAGAREATEVAGVSVGPVSAEDAARYKDSGNWSMPGRAPNAPQPGKSYLITMRYVVGPVGELGSGLPGRLASVLSGELHDVASGSCPQPFMSRPGHTYLIRCQVSFRAGGIGRATFIERTLTGTVNYSFNLTGPAGKAAGSATSPSLSTSASQDPQSSAAREYSEAAAGAREATEVAEVSVGPLSAQDAATYGLTGDAGPFINLSGDASPFGTDFSRVELIPGKSYSLMLKYLVGPGAGPVAVLTMELQYVASGSCPGPLLVRPAHTYLIRCQVTYLTTAAGQLRVTRRTPTGWHENTSPITGGGP